MKTFKTTLNNVINLTAEHSESIRIVVCLTPIVVLPASLLWAIATGQVDTNKL